MNRRYGETLAGGALESPAAERNKQPILDVLEGWLPQSGIVLDIASGTGQTPAQAHHSRWEAEPACPT